MKPDSRLSSVLHALLHMAEQGRPMTSDQIAACMCAHPVAVRRTMGFLRDAGIVAAARGPQGGWTIAADLSAVTLLDLHNALGEPAVFAIGHRNPAPTCLVEQAVNAAMDDALSRAEALLRARLGQITLATLAADFARRQAARRQTQDRDHDT